jgi:hypothetical protein
VVLHPNTHGSLGVDKLKYEETKNLKGDGEVERKSTI